MNRSIGFATLAALLFLHAGVASAVAKELPGDITTALKRERPK